MTGESKAAVTKRLMVTSSPHIHSGLTTARIMWDVNLALLPALAMALYNYRLYAVTVVVATILGAILAEYLIQRFMLQTKTTLCDGSAVVTGLLLALCLPASLPAWVAFLGGFISIALGKQIYGGLGQNVFNPAHVGRAVLLASWPVYMTSWLKPITYADNAITRATADALTMATPLGYLKEMVDHPDIMARVKALNISNVAYTMRSLHIDFSDMFYGIGFAGSIGETSKLALLIGALYLLVRGHIRLAGPVAMIATVFVGAFWAGGSLEYALFHLLAGGLVLGAFFMVTDMVTCPVSTRGNILFGIGCGVITILIRLKGGYPEGVCYSILIMNAFVPLIDKMFSPQLFGKGGSKK
jgi:electron transport complex protein RnfD